MAQGFRHTPHGYAARFEKAEFDLIRDLAEDVIALLESPDSENHDPLEALIGIVENPSQTIQRWHEYCRLEVAILRQRWNIAGTPNRIYVPRRWQI